MRPRPATAPRVPGMRVPEHARAQHAEPGTPRGARECSRHAVGAQLLTHAARSARTRAPHTAA
eukprot:2242715-Alexandrium_andersonii.AAC.1